MREMADRGKGKRLTTEFADEGESSIQLPSYEDVQKDLKRVRQKEGASVRRISTYGQSLQQLRISQDEFRRSGSQPGTLPMATIAALECAVRSYGSESLYFTVLDKTLNFRGARANLTDRQQSVMDELDMHSKTTYEAYERDTYDLFAFRIGQQAKSFCGEDNDAATAIANLPFEQRAGFIRVLLDARMSMLPLDRNVLAEDVLRALPGLSAAPPLDGMDPLQKVDRAVMLVIQSERYIVGTQRFKVMTQPIFHIIEEIARQYRQREFMLPGNDELAYQFQHAVEVRLTNLGREGVDQAGLPHFGQLSELSRRELITLVRQHGRFSEDGKPTPEFDVARFNGMGILASLLVEVDQSNTWKELFEQRPSARPKPPSYRRIQPKGPSRPRIRGGRESDY